MQKIGYKFFRFYDEENDKSYVIPLFDVEGFLGDEQFGHIGIDEDFYYDNIHPKMEERELETRYGIHDYSTHGKDMVIGYTSGEVEPNEFPVLMKEWQEILNEVGIITGSVEIYDGEVE